jgi:DGQHR domain-containing protein
VTELTNLYGQLLSTKDFQFLALAGKENARTTYTINVPFSTLVQAFKLVPHDADSKLLIQREAHATRIKGISNYLEDDMACLPATGAIVEDISAVHVQENMYMITIAASSWRYFFDGQGRFGGIDTFLKKHPDRGDNTLTIKLVKTEGIEKDNQLFSDWNGSSLKPNQSICKAMDSRTLINRYTKKIIDNVPQLSGRIDFTKASVTSSSKSDKLWTLNQFVTFVQMITGTTVRSAETLLEDEAKQARSAGFIKKYFEMLNTHPQLHDVFSGTITATNTRKKTVVGTSVWLKGLALTGKVIQLYLIDQGNKKADWSFMDNIKFVDFSKENPEWLGRLLTYRGKFEDKSFNHKAVAVYLLRTMGIPIPSELEETEEVVMLERAAGLKAQREEKREEQNTLDLTIDKEAA